MSETTQPISIHALPIVNIGGTPARIGFNVQDHVAARYCIEMLSDAEITAVWCEAHDDIVIIRTSHHSETVEFVQVKSEEPNQLWSTAKLCQQEGGKQAGTSMLERSLAHHACTEPCTFRIVTTRDVMDELKVLTHMLGSVERGSKKQSLVQLADVCAQRLNFFRSPLGEDSSYWIARATWEVVHSLDALEARNRLALTIEMERLGIVLLVDQIDELYSKLVRLVFDAALATKPPDKKLKRPDVLEWITKTANALAYPATVSGTRMVEKMKAADLPPDAIQAAHDTRWIYRQRMLTERYSAPLEYAQVEAEVVAHLNGLRAKLDSGALTDDGPAFHYRCLEKLEHLHASHPSAGKLGLGFLQGCMYNVTDRCGHRFLRVTA
jgi:hypothetical protein